MLYYALVFILVGLVAGVLGITGVAIIFTGLASPPEVAEYLAGQILP